MRAWLLVALVPLMTACSTTQPSTQPSRIMTPSALMMPSASLRDTITGKLTGRWVGTWVGTGMFNTPREDTVTLDLVQHGKVGYGRLILESTMAAESVPDEIRRQGLTGIRIFATISGSGSRMRVKHELGGQLFTADFKIKRDQMVGNVHNTGPSLRLFLTRVPEHVAPTAASVALAAPPPAAPAPAVTPPAPPPPPVAAEPAAQPAPPATRDIAAVPAPVERPRQEDYVTVPELKTVHFDFDRSALRPDARDILTTNAQWLKEHEDALVLVEGHCDDRGTPEYNLALGERRAKAVMENLEAHGVAAARISTITYGKEQPICSESTEECKRLNRRAEFRVKLP